jgi:hypothetical protein
MLLPMKTPFAMFFDGGQINHPVRRYPSTISAGCKTYFQMGDKRNSNLFVF